MNVEHQPTPKERVTSQTSKEKSPGWRALLIATAVLAAISLLLAGYGAYRSYFPMQEAAQSGAELGQQIKVSCAKATTPAQMKQLENFDIPCDQAAKVVEDVPPAASPTASPTAVASAIPGPAPTYSQVFAVVSDYCSLPGNCRGPKITKADVKAALLEICSGSCKGEPGDTVTGSPGASGSPGAAGSPGADSTVPGPVGPTGPAGPAPTPEQIKAGVADYCDDDPSNCTSEVVCPAGEPTQLEVRARNQDDPLDQGQWVMIQTCV
jgi:hypothetical protein